MCREERQAYDGYESYDYLEPGVDYKEFDLDRQLNSFEPYEVPLSEEENDRVERLSDGNVSIAPHEHPHLHPENMDNMIQYVHAGRIWTAYRWLAQTHLDCVIDAMLHGLEMIESKQGHKWDDVVSDIGMRMADIAHSKFVIQGKSIEDIDRAREEGKLAIVPAIEAAQFIENELDRLDIVYGLGVRMCGVTYNESNMLGSGSGDPNDAGLTSFGRAAINRMNKLGMAIGLSHESEQTTLDICQYSDDPVILSHTGSQEVWDTPREEPDHVLEAVADTKGLLAVEAAPNSTRSESHPEHSIESVMEHFEYMVNLVGIDHVTFSTDTMYGDHAELMEEISDMIRPEELFFDRGDDEETVDAVEYVKGMENPTEAWNNIPRWLVKEGYSDEEIRKVLGGNTYRVLDEIWE
jgi:membrane dipeptidase